MSGGCSYYEYLVAAYVTWGYIYTPLIVDAKTAWHSKGKLYDRTSEIFHFLHLIRNSSIMA